MPILASTGETSKRATTQLSIEAITNAPSVAVAIQPYQKTSADIGLDGPCGPTDGLFIG
jgi:hypothetical protein